MNTPKPILGVYGLSKRVKNRDLVKEITFEVFPGEVFGFLGPNGAGKTTTIRMLVGLIHPTAGRIVINGFDVRKEFHKAMQGIGCIVENPDLYPYLSGWENLVQLARMQGDAAVSRIPLVVRQVRLEARIHDLVRTYSLGMRQRLGIAQALLNDPKLLILDEPTNGLDPAGIHELRVFIRELADAGMSVFVSSHLLSEIELMCDRIGIIREGNMVQVARTRDLVNQTSDEVEWRVSSADAALPVLQKHARDSQCKVLDETRIICQMSEESTSQAAAELVNHGLCIYEIHRRRLSLEDVFLQTTGESAN